MKQMSKVLDILDCQGNRVDGYELPDAVLELEKGEQAVHDAVVAFLAGMRAGTAKTKTRAEVRGGGSKTDLTFFDSEALCRAVANYPVPVFTGIGHEIDRSLLDEVAYQACITPTDCAKRLIERASESWDAMVRAARDIAEGARACLGAYSTGLTSAGHRLQQILSKRFLQEKTNLAQIGVSLKKDMHFLFQSEIARLQRNADGLRQGTRKIIEFEKARFELSEQKVKSADPKQVLAKGYTLTLDANGKFIRNASELKPGDHITTRFRGGDVTSQVL